MKETSSLKINLYSSNFSSNFHDFAIEGTIFKFSSKSTKPLKIWLTAQIFDLVLEKIGSKEVIPEDSLYLNIYFYFLQRNQNTKQIN